MGKLSEEINRREEQKNRFNELDKGLREKIFSAGHEILTLLENEYDIESLGLNVEWKYKLYIDESSKKGLELKVDLSSIEDVKDERLFLEINSQLQKFYDRVEAEYGIYMSFRMPDYDFF